MPGGMWGRTEGRTHIGFVYGPAAGRTQIGFVYVPVAGRTQIGFVYAPPAGRSPNISKTDWSSAEKIGSKAIPFNDTKNKNDTFHRGTIKKNDLRGREKYKQMTPGIDPGDSAFLYQENIAWYEEI